MMMASCDMLTCRCTFLSFRLKESFMEGNVFQCEAEGRGAWVVFWQLNLCTLHPRAPTAARRALSVFSLPLKTEQFF